MRTKKHVEQTVKRHRRSNLDLVGLSREHLRTIKRISEMSQVPISRVGTDVIEIGIAAVLSTYQPMIEMEQARKERAEKIKRIFDNESETSSPIRPGIPDEQDELVKVEHQPEAQSERPADGITLDFSRATLRGPVDADVESGFGETADTDLGGDVPNSDTDAEYIF